MLIKKTHIAAGMSAAMLLLSGSAATVPVTQAAPKTGCTSAAAPSGNTSAEQTNRSRANRDAVIGNVVGAAVDNVLNLNAAVGALNSSSLQVVCLNDVLNKNDIRVLTNNLNNSLNQNDIDILNNSLNNASVLNNLAQNANVALLNNVQVVSVDLLSGTAFLLNQQ